MRSLVVVSLLVAFGAAGCKKADGMVVLTVTAASELSNLTSLHVTATAGGRTVEFDDKPASPFMLPPSRTLGIQFPAGVAGSMRLSVQARAGADTVAQGTTTATAKAGERSDVTITLGETANADMGAIGSTDMAGCGMVTACANSDGCCPAGCNQVTDNDCAPVCGNGVVEKGEFCDDKNNDNGDNCDPTCQFTNTVTLLSGTPDGIGRADGASREARLGANSGSGYHTRGAATDSNNNFYYGDRCSIKKMDIVSSISTIAGSDGDCTAEHDDTGTKATFTDVTDLVFVPNGNAGVLYVAGGATLRKVDLMTGQVSSITGVSGGTGLAADTDFLYIIDGRFLYKMPFINGTVSTVTSDLNGPCNDVIFYNGNYFVSCGPNGIQKVTNAMPPVISTYVPGGTCNAGSLTTSTVTLGNAVGMTVDSQGDLTVADSKCNVVWELDTNSQVKIIAGSPTFAAGHADAKGSGGTLNGPVASIYMTSVGATYVVDAGNHEIRGVPFLAGWLDTRVGVWGNDGSGPMSTGVNPIYNHPFLVYSTGKGDALVITVSFGKNPATDGTYRLNLSDGTLQPFSSQYIGGSAIIGDYIYLLAPNGDGNIWRYGLDGSPGAVFAGAKNSAHQPSLDGSLTSAILNPNAITTDGTNLFFEDSGTTVREVDIANGMVVTLAGTLGTTDVVDGIGSIAHFAKLTGQAIAVVGSSLYVVDGNDTASATTIRAVNLTTHAVTTVAGQAGIAGIADGIGKAASFTAITNMTTDGKSLFLTEVGFGPFSGSGNSGDVTGPILRQVELPSGRVSTMAGTRGVWTFRAGVGTAAAFNAPYGISFDRFTHSLLLADGSEDIIIRIK